MPSAALFGDLATLFVNRLVSSGVDISSPVVQEVINSAQSGEIGSIYADVLTASPSIEGKPRFSIPAS
jgi:hypothetical protein